MAESSAGRAPSFVQEKGVNGLDKLYLRGPLSSSAEIYIYLHGGHITSWKNNYREELLFVSNKKFIFHRVQHDIFFLLWTEAIFKPPKAIRGGISICFPQFGTHGFLEQHGFAANRTWSVDADPPSLPSDSSSTTFVDLILKPSEGDLKIWPHSFELRLRISLTPKGDLKVISRIRNTNANGKLFSFTLAYYSYFLVSDISEVRVEGLETMDYLDNLKGNEHFTEQGDALTFESEVDRIYLSTRNRIAIIDHQKRRTIVLHKEGLPDAVVWNPWDKKAKAMTDFGRDEYKRMICVEGAAVEKPITLKPGEEWKGSQEFFSVRSSYNSGELDPQKVHS